MLELAARSVAFGHEGYAARDETVVVERSAGRREDIESEKGVQWIARDGLRGEGQRERELDEAAAAAAASGCCRDELVGIRVYT